MKHTFTPFEGKNERVSFMDLIFGNCFLENDFGCYLAQPSPVLANTQLELLPSPTGENDVCKISGSSISMSVVHSHSTYDVWTLCFLWFEETRGIWSWLWFSRPATEKTSDLKPPRIRVHE